MGGKSDSEFLSRTFQKGCMCIRQVQNNRNVGPWVKIDRNVEVADFLPERIICRLVVVKKSL